MHFYSIDYELLLASEKERQGRLVV